MKNLLVYDLFMRAEEIKSPAVGPYINICHKLVQLAQQVPWAYEPDYWILEKFFEAEILFKQKRDVDSFNQHVRLSTLLADSLNTLFLSNMERDWLLLYKKELMNEVILALSRYEACLTSLMERKQAN